MKTASLKIDISDSIYSTLEVIGYNKERLDKNARENLAINLFTEGVLSFGQAAELAGLNKWTFMNLLREKKIPFYNFTDEEIAKEYKMMNKLSGKLKK